MALQTADNTEKKTPNLIVRFFQHIINVISKHEQRTQREAQMTDGKHDPGTDLKPNNNEDKETTIENAKASIEIKQNGSRLNLSTLPIDHEEAFDYTLRLHLKPNKVTHIELQNRITLPAIPITIGFFENLVVLNLRNNHISDLPWSIVYLKKLQEFDISYNMLTSLPRTIGHLISLKIFNLEANHLSFIPTELLRLQNLQSINFGQNSKLSPYGNLSRQLDYASLAVMLEKQRNRSNMWSLDTPYYISPESETAPQLGLQPKELLDIVVECILQCRVDYLSNQCVPTSVKNFLNDKYEETEHKLQLSKCSKCRSYFSTKFYFETHQCSKVSTRV